MRPERYSEHLFDTALSLFAATLAWAYTDS